MADIVVPNCIIKVDDVPSVLIESKPAIFWDTCSLLYYVSVIDRNAFAEYEKDYQLYEWVTTGAVYSVTSMIVMKEFNKHYKTIRDKDAEKENTLKHIMWNYGNIIGSPKKDDLEKGMIALELSMHMDDMVNSIWANTIVIDESPALQDKAHKRCLGYLPPSSVKSEYKDCYIWETFVEMCSIIPNKGISFFMTENTEDYCGNSKLRTPLEEIDKDVKRVQGQICFAKHLLWKEIAKMLGEIK
jgi:hypothetical protein